MAKQNLTKEEAQFRVLTQLKLGQTIKMAMESVGRSEAAFRQWTLTEPSFKEQADKARLDSKGIKTDLAELKNIAFEDFSQEFLDTSLFDHHLDWVDLVEGREPRFLHPSMTYVPGASNRVLINVPPEHA